MISWKENDTQRVQDTKNTIKKSLLYKIYDLTTKAALSG